MIPSYSTLERGPSHGLSDTYRSGSPQEFSPHSLILRKLTPSDDALKIFAKLQSFRQLKENWDGYNAAEPSEHAIRAAVRLVEDLDRAGQKVYFVAPGPNGEIVVEIRRGDRSLEVYIDEQGNREYVVFDGDRCVRESPSVSDVYELIAALE